MRKTQENMDFQQIKFFLISGLKVYETLEYI